MRFTLFLLISLLTIVPAQAIMHTMKPEVQDFEDVDIPKPASDPLENFNRAAYKLNDKFDKIVLKPLATVYNTILPRPIKKGVSNVFGNVVDVPTLANEVLQLRAQDSLSDVWRIAINTTVGIGGFFDVASRMGLKKHNQDLGLTLARWGYKESTYFVIPLFGPSTIRDAITLPINFFFLTIYPYMNDVAFRNYLWAGSVVVRRAEALKFEGVLEAAAFDPYLFQRNAYLQRQRHLIKKNENN